MIFRKYFMSKPQKKRAFLLPTRFILLNIKDSRSNLFFSIEIIYISIILTTREPLVK